MLGTSSGGRYETIGDTLMKLRSLLILMLALAALFSSLCVPLSAQDKPNSLGVTFHSIAFQVPDYDANIEFWTKLGLTRQAMNGSARYAVFHCPSSDVAITVQEDKNASGGSVGTVFDHIGFLVPDVPSAIEKWKAAGMKTEPGRMVQQGYVYTPDNVKIEFLQDTAMTIAIKPGHVHWFDSSTLDTQAWYAKMLGAVPGKRAIFDAGDVPNMNLSFSKASGDVTPSKGHALDHIGFAVLDIDQFKKDLQAKGVVFDPSLQRASISESGRVAFFVDPWGATIELIQLNPAGSSSNK